MSGINLFFKQRGLIIIIIMVLFHFFIMNGLEKTFFGEYTDSYMIKKNSKKCANNNKLNCIGIPSNYVESIVILCSLLVNYNYISFLWGVFIIFIALFNRINYSQNINSSQNVSTIFQIFIGIIFGLIYSFIYIQSNISLISLLIMFIISSGWVFIIINKIDKKINQPIPLWIDKKMIPSIIKKQNSPLHIKYLSIISNSIIHEKTHIGWEELTEYLDIIIGDIKNTGVKYDAVVGIKTGGAIISDYVSKKLNLKNYKIKLSKKENKCNKKSYQTYSSIINDLLKHKSPFTICEGIQEDVKGQNFVLIDELIFSGNTMNSTIDYLLNEKKLNYVYPVCISLPKNQLNRKYKLHCVINDNILIWPWGYDN